MTHDNDKPDSYARIFRIGAVQVAIVHYEQEPRPGPVWIFTVKRAGIRRVYKYVLRAQHIEEFRSCNGDEQIAHFLYRHVRSSDSVMTVEGGEDNGSKGTTHKG